MTKLVNQIEIQASTDKIWSILANLEALDKYDPTVAKSAVLPGPEQGIGAKRKVTMNDGKNWFEEKVTEWQPKEALAYTLTDCSFPISGLNHRYTFKQSGRATVVEQTMTYKVKFGWLGRLLDFLMVRKQTDNGIKIFFSGLKKHAESQ